MKIRKQILTEELGLPRNNKKSYTTNKKQKIKLSENQLQRLISKLNEDKQIITERWWVLDWLCCAFGGWGCCFDLLKGQMDFRIAEGGPKPPLPTAADFGITDSEKRMLRPYKNKLKSERTLKAAPREIQQIVAKLNPQGYFNKVKQWNETQKATTGRKSTTTSDAGVDSSGDPRPQDKKPNLVQEPVAEKFDKLGRVISERRRKPEPTSPKDGYKCYRCAEGGPVGYTSFKPCPKANSNPKKLKCCCKMTATGQIVPPQSVGNQGIVCPKSSTPAKCKGNPFSWGNSSSSSSSSSSNGSSGTRYRIDAGGCLACPAGTPASVCPYTEPTCGGQSNNNVAPQCCKDPQGNQIANNCNNCAAPNTCGNCNPVSETRLLKTTNSINESDVVNMKKWFNRVNKAGNKYNPSVL